MTKLFKKLFGDREESDPEVNDAATIPVKKVSQSQEVTMQTSPSPATVAQEEEKQVTGQKDPQLLASSAQSVGQQRDHNEDALFTLTTLLSSEETHAPFGLYIVADGMGGHQHGEVASEIAVRKTVEHIMRGLYYNIYSADSRAPEEPLHEILETAIREAHDAILNYAPGGGTTLTVVIIIDEQMVIAHIGDSRVYTLKQDGTMNALTRDHSLVKRLEELGQLTPEEASIHPQRNVLYRALGQGEYSEPEIITSPTPDSGYLLICSDGLWGVVSESELSEMVLENHSLYQACQSMVEAANEAGGPDNITVILVQLPE